MRALQREFTTACYTCTHSASSRLNSAGRGRNRPRKHRGLSLTSQDSHRRQEQLASAGHNRCFVRNYAESGGGGGGGYKGRDPTTFDDGNDSPPWSQYSLFGITIMLVSLIENCTQLFTICCAWMCGDGGVGGAQLDLLAGLRKLPTACHSCSSQIVEFSVTYHWQTADSCLT